MYAGLERDSFLGTIRVKLGPGGTCLEEAEAETKRFSGETGRWSTFRTDKSSQTVYSATYDLFRLRAGAHAAMNDLVCLGRRPESLPTLQPGSNRQTDDQTAHAHTPPLDRFHLSEQCEIQLPPHSR